MQLDFKIFSAVFILSHIFFVWFFYRCKFALELVILFTGMFDDTMITLVVVFNIHPLTFYFSI